jgi:hypothetical protein
MVAYAYDTIARGNPLGFFGMVHVLEGTSVALALRAADAIQKPLALPDSAFSYLRSTARWTRRTRRTSRLMDRIDDPADQAAIVHAARAFFRLYGDVFRGLPRPRREDRRGGRHEGRRCPRAADRRQRRHRPRDGGRAAARRRRRAGRGPRRGPAGHALGAAPTWPRPKASPRCAGRGPTGAQRDRARRRRAGLRGPGHPVAPAQHRWTVLQANLLAPMQLTQALLPSLMALPQAQVVFVGSALAASACRASALYGASKAGLHGFAEALRRELADGPVRVQILGPRSTRTAFNGAPSRPTTAPPAPRWTGPRPWPPRCCALIEGEAAERFIGFPERLAVRLNGMLGAGLDGSFARHRRHLSVHQGVTA